MTSFSYKLFLPEVKRAVDSANIRVLKRQGAYLRGVAKRSIRYKKNSAINSAPGSAPYTHGRKVLKNAIMFAYDAASMTVVIGPSNNKVGDIAATHEHGGTEQHKKKDGSGYYSASYPARPYMGPAFEKIKNKLPEFWHNAIK